MPIRYVEDGRDMLAFDLDEDEWQQFAGTNREDSHLRYSVV